MKGKKSFEEKVAELVRAVRDQIADEEWADLQEIVTAVVHMNELRRERERYWSDEADILQLADLQEIVAEVRDQIADDDSADLQETVAEAIETQESRREREEAHPEDPLYTFSDIFEAEDAWNNRIRVRPPRVKQSRELRKAVESYVEPRGGEKSDTDKTEV